MRQEEADEELVEPLDLMTFDMLTSRGRLSTEEVYAQVQQHSGISYGEPIQLIEAAWMSNRRMIMKLKNPVQGPYLVHPSLMETAFNTLFARAANDGINGELISVGQLQLLKEIPDVENSWLIATFQNSEIEGRSSLKASFVYYAPDGHAYATVSGMRYVSSSKPSSTKRVPEVKSVAKPVAKEKVVEEKVPSSSSAEIGDLQEHIIKQVSKVTKAPVSRIKPTMTFKSLGVDSLMAVQLKNLLAKTLPVKITVSAFWAHPTIKEYTTFLKGMLKETGVAKSEKQVAPKKTEQTSTQKMDNMSLAELASALDDELDGII